MGETAGHECVIADACCVINLYASGQMEGMLRSLPQTAVIADFVRDNEVLNIYGGPDDNVRQCKTAIDLEPLISQNLMQIVTLDGPDEGDLFIHLAGFVQDGEAITAAIAINRNWTIATDDGKAGNVIRKIAPHIKIVSTPELVKHWADTTHPPRPLIMEAIKRIEQRARYRPSVNHTLYNWWIQPV